MAVAAPAAITVDQRYPGALQALPPANRLPARRKLPAQPDPRAAEGG